MTSFHMVKNLSQIMVLGTPFLTQLYPIEVSDQGISNEILGKKILFEFKRPIKTQEIQVLSEAEELSEIRLKEKQIAFLKEEVSYKRIEENLQERSIQSSIESLKKKFEQEVCADHPNAFWERKQHMVNHPYIEGFTEEKIPTKARPIHMNVELLTQCKKEINELIYKKTH